MALVDAMTTLLDCVTAQLTPTPARAYLTTGQLLASWDDCCSGEAWVRLVSQEATAAPKMGMAAQAPCKRSWLVTLNVGVLRCSSQMSDSGQVPPPSDVTADAVQTITDKDAILDAVQCCLPSVSGVASFALTRWDALGPDGGCVGGEWTLAMIVQTLDCEEPP